MEYANKINRKLNHFTKNEPQEATLGNSSLNIFTVHYQNVSPMRIALFILFLFLTHTLFSQPRRVASKQTPALTAAQRPTPSKPELSFEYFDKISYTLPKDLLISDSVRLTAQVERLARQVQQAVHSATTQFQTTDPDLLAFLIDAQVTASISLQQFGQVAQNVQKYQRLLPAPTYQVPYGLIALAYADAAKQVAGPGKPALTSPQFKTALQTAFRTQLNALPGEHRNDIVNAMKAQYTPKSITVVKRTLEQLIEQAQKSGQLPFESTLSLIAAHERSQRLTRYRQSLEDVLYSFSPSRVDEQTVQIPMRDGVKLNAILYRDLARTSRVPALVSLSPYPTGNEATRGNVFATNGYVWLYVDTRGRRASEGEFMPYEHDAQDLYDIIDWASKQPWCDGQVATTGGSYLGFVQWQSIRKSYKHPALKAINPMASVGFGIDFPRESNIFYPYILQWATYVSGKELNQAQFNDYTFWAGKAYQAYKNRVPFAKLDSVAGLPSTYFQRWVSHPDFDTYWQTILPTPEDYASIDIPILTTTGYYDADQNGAMYYYNNHQRYGTQAAKARHHLLIGPYDHGGAQWQPRTTQSGLAIEKEAQIPLYKNVIQWFDWVLKGKQRPHFVQDRINYFAVGTGQWRGTPSLQAATQDTLRLYLSPNAMPNKKRANLQSLSRVPESTDRPIIYKHDIASTLDSAWLFSYAKPFDDTRYMTSPHNLVFETAPLEKDLLVTNKIIPRIQLSLNVPDADFMVRLYEITPDGKNHNLGYSAARARYRHGGDKPQLMIPGQPDNIVFEATYIYIRKLSRGSRLRLTFENINTPEYEKNYGFGGVVSRETTTGPRIIEATLHTGPGGSRIEIPYAETVLAEKSK